MPVKKFGKIPRENMNFSAKSIKFVPVKEKKVGVKKLENGPKSGREIGFLPVKKLKKWPKMAFTGTFYFHGKKKNTVYRHDLELTIQMKFLSLRIPVEVTAYTRLDKHRTSDKTFTVTFQSSAHARAALQLIEQRRLDFRMNEARPSPRYHVKFIVLCRQGFFLPVNAGSAQ